MAPASHPDLALASSRCYEPEGQLTEVRSREIAWDIASVVSCVELDKPVSSCGSSFLDGICVSVSKAFMIIPAGRLLTFAIPLHLNTLSCG
jgi:hypothetical protein